MTHSLEIFAAGLAAGIVLRPAAAAVVQRVLATIAAARTALAAKINPPPPKA